MWWEGKSCKKVILRNISSGFQTDMMLQCKQISPFPSYLIPNSYSLANPLFQKSWWKTYLLETTFPGKNPAMIFLDLTPVHSLSYEMRVSTWALSYKNKINFSTYLVSRSLKFITWRHESSIRLTWFTFHSILRMGSKTIASNQMIPFSWVSSADLIRTYNWLKTGFSFSHITKNHHIIILISS